MKEILQQKFLKRKLASYSLLLKKK